MDNFGLTCDSEDIIKDWIGEAASIKFKLKYRASRDGFAKEDFHKEARNCRGPLMMMFKNKDGYIFGFYTSQDFKNNDQYVKDEKSFLFSLTHKTKHEAYQNLDYTIYYSSSYIIQLGNDLIIMDNPNNNQSSYSNIGYCFQPPRDIYYDSDAAKNYLGGKYNFRISEFELYQVTNPIEQ